MSSVTAIAAARGRRTPGLRVDKSGRLILPPSPDRDDQAAQCRWLTAVFALDPSHPIVAGKRQGVFGPEGHIELKRGGARSIRIEPLTRLLVPMRLHETLASQTLPSDRPAPAFKAEHCREIAYVVRMLCGQADTLSYEQEAAGIVAAFMATAQAREGLTTYGTTAQRYEAASALRRRSDEHSGRPIGPPHYLIDSETGEFVIAVGDLADAARRHIGSSLPRGWLDGRMDMLGWRRVSLQGFGLPGRTGRERGPHARLSVYRGVLAYDEPVNT
jgi:hypothetical protein